MCSFIARYLQSPAPSVRSAPGGKSVHWQANQASPSRDMPVESFYGWALNPDLRPVPAPGKRRLTARAGDTFVANVTTTVQTSSADFGGLETSGAAHRPAPALAGGEARRHSG